jgi:hypothetical protein
MAGPRHLTHGRGPLRTAASLFRLVACLGIAAGAAACGRGRPADPPPARVSAAAQANDSMSPIARDSTDRCRWEAPVPLAHTREEYRYRWWDEASLNRGVPLRCALRGGGPEVRVVVRGDGQVPRWVDVYSPPDARVHAQTLEVRDNDEPAHEHSDLAVGEDLNDDGWTDLWVQTWSGTAGVYYEVFMWNPRRHRFEQDSVFPGGTSIYAIDGRPCVGEERRGYPGYATGGEYCWARGGWHLVRTYRLDNDHASADPRNAFFVRTTEWLEDGRVLRTWTDTLPADSARRNAEFRSGPPQMSRRAGDDGRAVGLGGGPHRIPR